MSHSIHRIRQVGMKVAEELSLIVTPDNPLRFDELSSSPEESTLTAPKREVKKKVRSEKKSRDTIAQPNIQMDPDDIALSSSDDETDKSKATTIDKISKSESIKNTTESGAIYTSDSDSDDSLEAYALSDDEDDKQKVTDMVYIRDIIEGLNSDDDREKNETALASVEKVIRNLPHDLHDFASDVTCALTRLDDKYNTPNFDQMRTNALAALCVKSPVEVVPTLISQIYDTEKIFQTKLDIMQSLVLASQELSQSGQYQLIHDKLLLQENIEIMEKRTEKGLRTRRWGYQRDAPIASKRNDFAAYAGIYFYPLLFGYSQYAKTLKESPRIVHIDQYFLAHVIHTLACFLESSGSSLPTIKMGKSLLEFIWSERGNQTASVRRQILYAFSRILLVVPAFILQEELMTKQIGILQWLNKIGNSDSDEGCRSAASMLLSSAQYVSSPFLSR